MRERATKDDKRKEPNEGWGGAVPGGTATRTGKRPMSATCVGVILVVRQKGGALSAITCGKRQTRWCNVERTPDWPCFLVRATTGGLPSSTAAQEHTVAPHGRLDFIAHGIRRIPRVNSTAHLERNRRAGAGTSRRVCAALVRRTTRALRWVGSAPAANRQQSFIYDPRCDPAMMRCKPKFGSYKQKFGSNDPNFGSNDPNFGLKCDATEPSRVRVRLRMLGAHRLGQLH